MKVGSSTFKNQEHRVWGKAKAIPRYSDLLRKKFVFPIWARWQIGWAEQTAKPLRDKKNWEE